MADDPRRAAMAQWRRAQETGVSVSTASPGVPQLRTRRTSPSYTTTQPRSSIVSQDAAPRSLSRPPGPLPPSNGRNVSFSRPDGLRTRRAFPDEDQKGALKPERTIPEKVHLRSHSIQQETSDRDAYRQQREKQRDLQLQLARMLDAHRASTTSSSVAYYELTSPARPQERPSMENHGGIFGNQPMTHGNRRRVAPSDVMHELDEDFRRSFHEHQQPTTSSSQENENGEPSEGQTESKQEERDTFEDSTTSPPPVMDVRVQFSHPPFREELSSDLSDYPSAAPVSSEPQSSVSPRGGMSTEFDFIPSISLTPPASPAHSQSMNASTTAEPISPPMPARETRPSRVDKFVFPTWSLGFLAGCVVVGLGGIFMEELMEWTGVFVTPSPFRMSMIEQREMSRRLDLLQQELLSFRVAASEIEQQSQRMVHEVRAHLEKMKSERERHQKMISTEMEALRRYVQAVANELVEDEKKEIRKRLLETIADTIVELPDNLDENEIDGHSTDTIELQSSPSSILDPDEQRQPIEENKRTISALDGDVVMLLEDAHEADLLQQVDETIANTPSEQVIPTLPPTVATVTTDTKPNVDAGNSLFSWELALLLAGVAVIAGIVGVRVRRAKRRNTFFLQKKPTGFWNKKPTTSKTDESDVETVSFFRGDSDGEATFDRLTSQSEDDAYSEYSEYSEEQKDGDVYDDYESPGGRDSHFSTSSNGEEYEFHAAEMSGDISNHSDVESLDESPSLPTADAPTPYPRMQQKLHDRLADESPLVRRSPRVQRSSLSQMR